MKNSKIYRIQGDKLNSIKAPALLKPYFIALILTVLFAAFNTVKSYADSIPVIILKGDTGLLDTMKVEQGYHFVEPGDSAHSDIYGDISARIVVTSKLVGGTSPYNYLLTNTYIFSYNVTDTLGNAAQTKYRVVRVTPDKTPPDLKLAKNAKTGADTIFQEVSSSPVNINPALSSYLISSKDLVDGNLTASVFIDSSLVQTTVVGVCRVSYSSTDISGNKTIKYMYVDVIDTIKPVLTLKGANPYTIQLRTKFVDPGVKITCPNNYLTPYELSRDLRVTSTVDDSIQGTYKVTYSLTDTFGNTAVPVTRTVYVGSNVPPPTIELVGPDNVSICQYSVYKDAGYKISGADSAYVKVDTFGNFRDAGITNVPYRTMYLYYTATDTLGNVSTSGTREITILAIGQSPCFGKIDSIDTVICKGSCPVLTPPVSGTSYHWNTGETTKSIQLCLKSDSAIEETVYNGSSTTYVIYNIKVTSTTCVWPGDANSDGIADNNDVLAIGVAYNDTGAKRPGATTNWTGQPCNDWSGSFTSGVNHKNADCNGDGVVDSTDMLAVSKNYGYKHYKAASPNGNPTDPGLSVAFSGDSTKSGDTATATINLGSSSNPVSDAYGIAFSLNYNFQYVKAGKSTIDLTNTWLGTPGKNLIYFIHDDSANGTIDIAITRTDHKNITGYGELAKVSIVMQDNLGGKTIVNRKVVLTPSHVNMISFNQSQIPLYATGDSVVVTGPLASVSNISKAIKDIRMYPNPASQVINIDPGNENITNIRIINTLGMVVYMQNEPNKGILQIPVSSLNPGIYTVIIDSKNRTATRQIYKN